MDKDIVKKYQDIKKNVEELSVQLAEISKMTTDKLSEAGEQYIEEMTIDTDKAVDVAKQKTKEVKEYVSDNPWSTIGVASLIILVIGLLLGHSKCHRE